MRISPYICTNGSLFLMCLAVFLVLFPTVGQAGSTELSPELRGKEPLPAGSHDPFKELDAYGKKQAPSASKGVPVPPVPGVYEFGSAEEEMQGLLLTAMAENDVAQAKQLLKEGASPNSLPGGSDITPLMVVTSSEMARMLLDAGGDPAARDDEGNTVLHYAVVKKQAPELIRLFASFGVSANNVADDKEAPIFRAITYFHEAKAFHAPYTIPGDLPVGEYDGPDPKKTLQALMAADGDIDARDAYGNTPLMIAATVNNTDLLDLLLELGADKNLKGPGGSTAKSIAYDLGHRAIYQRLE